MAKEVKVTIKMRIPGGGATPAPPVGSFLGQAQVNIMEFCKQFNAQTSNKKGETVPVVVTVYKDKSFDFVLKTPPTTELILKAANLKKGSSVPNKNKVGTLTQANVEEIAKIKLPDLNAMDIDEAKKVVVGTARSMGILVE